MEKKELIYILVSGLEIYSTMVASMAISKLQSKFIDDQMSEVQLEFDIKAKD